MLCYKCKLDLAEIKFSTASRNIRRNCKQSYCKSCMNIYGNLHRANNREYHNLRARNRLISPKQRLKTLLNASTVDRSQLDFKWSWQKLEKQNFKCEITGASFVYTPKHPQALSIDKIDPNKPYTKDNVRFICWWINAAMSNWGLETLQKLIKDWYKIDN